MPITLHWRYNGHDGASNHQPHHCSLNRSFRRRSKKTSKLRVTGLCARNSPVTGEFHTQMASKTENASNWWRHYEGSEIPWYIRQARKNGLITHNNDYFGCYVIHLRCIHCKWIDYQKQMHGSNQLTVINVAVLKLTYIVYIHGILCAKVLFTAETTYYQHLGR